MPSKNSTKQYVENGYYHVYNRGVEKRLIFIDRQDYNVFLSYLKEYLLPKNEKELSKKLADPDITSKERDKIHKALRLNNFSDEISLIAYCLMPNHFHLLIKQKSAGSMDKFMNSLCTRYTMYFNHRYNRVGALYQDVYKAVFITSEVQFLYLTKYIHKQALAFQGDALEPQPSQPSSFENYVYEKNFEWVKSTEVLSYFSKTNPNLSYKSFIYESDDFSPIQQMLIESN